MKVTAGYISAIFGLLGALVGGLTSFATTFATQRAQLGEIRRSSEVAKLESIFKDFITEASRLHVDALSHEKDDLAELVRLYGIVATMRLLASDQVINAAEHVMEGIVDGYLAPNLTLHDIRALAREGKMDLLHGFSSACRLDLTRLKTSVS